MAKYKTSPTCHGMQCITQVTNSNENPWRCSYANTLLNSLANFFLSAVEYSLFFVFLPLNLNFCVFNENLTVKDPKKSLLQGFRTLFVSFFFEKRDNWWQRRLSTSSGPERLWGISPCLWPNLSKLTNSKYRTRDFPYFFCLLKSRSPNDWPLVVVTLSVLSHSLLSHINIIIY